MSERDSDERSRQLGLVHELAATRRANEHMALALKALTEEPGRETLEKIDKLLIEAGLVNMFTVDAVKQLIDQRRASMMTRERMHQFVEVVMCRQITDFVWGTLTDDIRHDIYDVFEKDLRDFGVIVQDD